MSAKFNVIESEWCEIVFENHNKQYGAYQLRREYSRNIVLAIFLTTLIFGSLFLLPLLINSLQDKIIQTIHPVTGLINLEKPPVFDIPDPVIKNTPSPAITTIKNVKPVIVPDHKVNNDNMPANHALTTTATSTSTQTGTGTAPAEPVTETTFIVAKPAETVIKIAEIMPSFPGGEAALIEYLKRHIHYPAIARDANIQGKVYVSFIIGKDGKVRDAEILKGIRGLDEEALRVIRGLPSWMPGKQGGENVAVQFMLPIHFRLAQ